MSRVPVYEFGNLIEGQSLILKARIVTDVGTRVSSDGASSTVAANEVEIKVWDVTGDPPHSVQNATTTLAVATAFTAGATGYLLTGWETDSIGYNMLIVMPSGTGALFTVDWKGGHTYKVEVKISFANGVATINPGAQNEGPISFIGRLDCEPAYGQT